MKSHPTLFGVQLPQTSVLHLRSSIRNLQKNSKTNLVFHYSEFLLRANRNPWYKETLNNAQLSAIDGKGLHWAMWTKMGRSLLPKLFGWVIQYPVFIRLPLFVILFSIQLVCNMFVGAFVLLTKYPMHRRTKNQVILGRSFVYDLLTIAEENQWKTLILGGSSQSDEVTKNLIKNLFPELDLLLWTRKSNSLLMRDQHEYSSPQTLHAGNICQYFPDLHNATEFIKEHKPDLILTCLGGASGKQEFFIEHLRTQDDISYTLATGLGAAVDHLGGGKEQKVAPKWMIGLGLEWLHRFIAQPYRRKRILDSIFTLWWWTTVEQFQQYGGVRETAVSIVEKGGNEITYLHESQARSVVADSHKEVLILERKNWLPSDLGWTFVQGMKEKNESLVQTAVREVGEEAGLDISKLEVKGDPDFTTYEPYSISFMRFVLMGAYHRVSKKYVVPMVYTGREKPTPNWENRRAVWVPKLDVQNYLSVEKFPEWQRYRFNQSQVVE